MKEQAGADFLSALFPPGGSELFSPVDLLLAMTVSALLAFVLSAVYRHTHRGTSYSQSFLVTMVLMAVATSVVTRSSLSVRMTMSPPTDSRRSDSTHPKRCDDR